ncbi:restriction endonuclease subunit S [Billgrantia antri]|uniref:Restriction endonuclease subunit S n=1 Tax=Billgrantia antri TaxID=2846777 RepID=A0ABS6ZLS3_9GAMM|nr:restriction endonuclease subunit S [Halomonas antri]MBW6391018.1 restriction endonuclease subunit S [Halomonas antri]
MSAQKLITDHLDLWTSAVTHKNGSGRNASGKNGKIELTGIKKLRELILELAVRGKLVEQDPSEEPASVLLDRIAEEKTRLVKEGKIKKPKKLPEIATEDMPYAAPKNWKWVRFGNLFPSFQNGASSRGDNDGEQVAVIRLADIDNLEISLENTRLLPIDRKSIEKYSVTKNDILIIRVNGSQDLVGQLIPVRNNLNAIYCDHFIRVRIPESLVATEYLCLLSASSIFRSRIKELFVSTAGQKTVNQKHVSSLPTPLPPLDEQHRIVEKVDELMALCDRLEQQIGDQWEAHQILVDTLLDALARSTDAAELAENWARVAEHFDTLFTSEASIDKLKQTILQLAVMGRLVEQDPNDEPVSVLLERIAEEKARLLNEGKIKKSKPLPEIEKNQKAFFLPKTWRWIRFGTITFNRDSERIPLSVDDRSRRQGGYDYYGASGVIDKIDEYLFDKPLLLIGEDGANLINRSTPIAFIARGKYWVNNHAHVIDGISEDFLKYLCLYINAISLEPYVTGTAQPKMNQAKMNSIVVGLPPKQEQQRITEKFEELTALCDQLKARLGEAGETRAQLAKTVVEQAVS